MRIEFHADGTGTDILTPIVVADALIRHTTHHEANKVLPSLLPEGDYQTFDTDDLEQIAEHLLVHCKHNKEGGAE